MNEPLFVDITDRQSAQGHIETAILLWFEEKDPSSIHTLAAAAQGVLNQMCMARDVVPSQINELIEKQTPAMRALFRMPQNFFKHGTGRLQKPKGVVRHVPMLTELVLIDCISMYQRLFETATPLMLLFAFRYALFDPKAFPMQMTLKGIKADDLKRFSRPHFLKEVFPRFRGKAGNLPPLKP